MIGVVIWSGVAHVRETRWGLATLAVGVLVVVAATECAVGPSATAPTDGAVKLPRTSPSATMTLDEALASRRSVREFTPEPPGTQVIGHLLWAAQGITSADGGRTAPSAGALYPLELYIATNDGVSHYRPEARDLVVVGRRDVRADLRAAALGQDPVAEAPLVIVIAADYARTAEKYGTERGARYVQLEAGHAAQNVLLEAVALGLGAVPIGAFDDAAVARVLGLPAAHAPLYLIAVGHKR